MHKKMPLNHQGNKIFKKNGIIYYNFLDFPLEKTDAKRPDMSATVQPTAEAEKAPPKTPKNPISTTAFFTPFAMFPPNPIRGREAPHPEILNKGS